MNAANLARFAADGADATHRGRAGLVRAVRRPVSLVRRSDVDPGRPRLAPRGRRNAPDQRHAGDGSRHRHDERRAHDRQGARGARGGRRVGLRGLVPRLRRIRSRSTQRSRRRWRAAHEPLGFGDESPSTTTLHGSRSAVAVSAILYGRETAGIWNVGALADVRGRGIGRETTLTALRDARDPATTISVLGSSPLGLPVYTRIGSRGLPDSSLRPARVEAAARRCSAVQRPASDKGVAVGRAGTPAGDLSGDLGRCRPRRERAVPRGRLGDGPLRHLVPDRDAARQRHGFVRIGLFLTLSVSVSSWPTGGGRSWRSVSSARTPRSRRSASRRWPSSSRAVGTGRPQRGRQRRRMPRRRVCRDRAGPGALMHGPGRRRHGASRCSSARRDHVGHRPRATAILEYLGGKARPERR